MTIVQPASSGARTEIPPIISVDDHIVEPPHLWQEWLPPGTATAALGSNGVDWAR